MESQFFLGLHRFGCRFLRRFLLHSIKHMFRACRFFYQFIQRRIYNGFRLLRFLGNAEIIPDPQRKTACFAGSKIIIQRNINFFFRFRLAGDFIFFCCFRLMNRLWFRFRPGLPVQRDVYNLHFWGILMLGRLGRGLGIFFLPFMGRLFGGSFPRRRCFYRLCSLPAFLFRLAAFHLLGISGSHCPKGLAGGLG